MRILQKKIRHTSIFTALFKMDDVQIISKCQKQFCFELPSNQLILQSKKRMRLLWHAVAKITTSSAVVRPYFCLKVRHVKFMVKSIFFLIDNNFIYRKQIARQYWCPKFLARAGGVVGPAKKSSRLVWSPCKIWSQVGGPKILVALRPRSFE